MIVCKYIEHRLTTSMFVIWTDRIFDDVSIGYVLIYDGLNLNKRFVRDIFLISPLFDKLL